MKCPRCWTDKAYLRRYRGWLEPLLACLAFRPMKCTYCYHTFVVHWFFTVGQRVDPPILRVTHHDPRSHHQRRRAA